MIGKFVSRDLAVDIGTATTIVYVQGKGVILSEPTMVAVKDRGGKKIPVAFGREAKSMLGRTPEGVEVIQPVRTGVIADFDIAGLLLNHVICKARKESGSLFRPRVVVGVPSGITEVERRAVEESIVTSGARDVRLIEETIASAIGCNLPISEASASMVVDIGGGTTDIAVISLNDIVCSVSLRQGGTNIDRAIINHLRRAHKLFIGERTAELIKITIGSAHPSFDDQRMEVQGRGLSTGLPSGVVVNAREIREAIDEVLMSIVYGIKQTLESTPPELSGDIISSGISLAGGGAMLKGLDKYLAEKLGLKVTLAADPQNAVVHGAGLCLENRELFASVLK
ncbi:MAG: rod shape-determining protein [Candidatus Dadabacteria bacterium]|nr:MAG: rod shape-determining protein [Candidatus Dadabacteria bacterium]